MILDDMPPEDQLISAAEEYLNKDSNTEESVLPEHRAYYITAEGRVV